MEEVKDVVVVSGVSDIITMCAEVEEIHKMPRRTRKTRAA